MVTHAVADTDVFVDLLRRHLPAVAWLDTQASRPAMCGFSAYELYEGCRDRTDTLKVMQLLEIFPLVWPSARSCSEGLVEFPARFLRYRLGAMDSLIAATVLEVGGTLYTFNTKHFRAVDGRVIEQPYAR